MKVYCSTCKTVHVFPCEGEVAGFAYKPVEQPEWVPVAESLSRRLDALEKQAGPIGKLYVTDVEHATGTVSFDTKDPKDALIRDLMHHVYPYVIWNDTKNGFRDRAEKLGVKLS